MSQLLKKETQKLSINWSKESDEKLKKLKKKIRASINWTEEIKWIAEGQPYEEHEEVLMFLNKNNSTYLRSNETERNNTNGRRKLNKGNTLTKASKIKIKK
ncbi:hypothetical protein Glove_227g101 [Diversispora epigaea]|uniref:Uncharacterized protein n=1 Tax=Diversispora epigaea TaxID=1348612 RepID=A0A397IEB8_9GLOM|nr:hypothetical protein Glove_227g101 [Diversispora epigaea]